MKKIFEQPELMVVYMNNKDIVTTSETITRNLDEKLDGVGGDAADRFRDFDVY